MGLTAAMSRALRQEEQVPTWMVDAVLGTVFVVLGVFTSVAGKSGATSAIYREPDAVALLLVLVATVPYFFRRRAPVAVFMVSSAAVSALMLRGYDEGALPFMTVVGAYTVAACRPAREVAFSTAYIALLLVLVLAGNTPAFGLVELVSSYVAFAGAFLIGWTFQSRRRRIEAFENEQAATALRAAAEERLRIAQELHDVVAHSLGVIAVQAGVGMKVIDADPEEARLALENISRTSRSSLAEIRRVLGMVRNEEGAPSYTPAPGLADVPRLVEEVANAGLPVDLRVDGELDVVPAGVGLAAYRIVQEALTNALRHAAANRATVRLDSTKDLLCIEVVDDGSGPNGSQPQGHGLVGMRERAAVYGGTLEAGRAAGGGFRIAARLPYEGQPVS